ncbi:hypothetical protein Bbelb_444960 [Branchiostoma belcheri]|nr:hypothetical protein Bbelb_444960 [Branchiostoma belcheri]
MQSSVYDAVRKLALIRDFTMLEDRSVGKTKLRRALLISSSVTARLQGTETRLLTANPTNRLTRIHGDGGRSAAALSGVLKAVVPPSPHRKRFQRGRTCSSFGTRSPSRQKHPWDRLPSEERAEYQCAAVAGWMVHNNPPSLP